MVPLADHRLGVLKPELGVTGQNARVACLRVTATNGFPKFEAVIVRGVRSDYHAELSKNMEIERTLVTSTSQTSPSSRLMRIRATGEEERHCQYDKA